MEEVKKTPGMGHPVIRKIYEPCTEPKEATELLRVAAYCRVSTKSDEQSLSYETQVAVYEEKIRKGPGWAFAGIYADRGITGTQSERRPMFLKMVEDCEQGKIDVILCKSISRFSRNTLDAINYIRHLRDLGIRLIFEKEKIDTSSKYSEMFLTVLAAFAQEESRSHSENVKWGKRKRLEKGKALLIECYGYRKAGDTYEIVPQEAEAVRLIFELYELGTSVPEITRTLKERGYPMPNGKRKVWDETRIYYMIENEKYAGDLKTQKYYKKSFMDYRGYKNDGCLPSVLLKNHHEPIITRKQFDRCNVILDLKKKSTPSQYPFAQFLRCPYCGHVLHHRRLDIQNVDSHYCCEGEGACRGFAIMAIPLKNAVLKAYNDLKITSIQALTDNRNKQKARAASDLLILKEKYPAMSSIEYWWLDEAVSEITLGQHSYTASDLELLPKAAARISDDRTVAIKWKCGLVSTLSSGVLRDSQDPRHKAILWDNYILRYPDRHPKLTEEVRQKKEKR